MLSSKKLKRLQPYINILEEHRGRTLRDIAKEFGKDISDFKGPGHGKGAGGLLTETLLNIPNNNSPKADLEDINVEIKVLPIQLSNHKVKEPTQLKMINFMKIAQEQWETAQLRNKIETIFWIVYGVKKDPITKKFVSMENYILIDWFIDVPDTFSQDIFKKDWEEIQSYIIRGDGDKLSCSMGTYIEPKTKGRNNRDLTQAPNGKGGTIMVRRRAFYFKKKYTNSKIVPELDFSSLNND